MEDIVIIGAGVTGCSIARELSRYDINITLVEKEEDVACGTSKANSAVVHAGFDATPGTWKAKLNVAGNKLYPALCEELDVPFKMNGSLVVAVNEEEVNALDELLKKGKTNGVNPLRIIGKDELHALEPNLNPDARAALDAPTGGLVCPYELTIALAENANQNGVKFWLNAPVTDIEVMGDYCFLVKTPKGNIKTKYVINAAGLFADEISKMAGAEEYTITPRKGEYLIFDKQFGNMVKKAIFPTPTKISKGILVCPTVDGNIFIGPNSNDIEDKYDTSVNAAGIEEIISGGRKLVPNLPLKNVITSFAGLRAVSNTNDFIIEASKLVKGFINVGGIQSPGLTSAPAIALMVKDILQEAGLDLKKKKDFIPHRPKKYRFRELGSEERRKLIEQNSAFGHVICRCETVTEAEIIDAIRRPVGARSIDAVKRRTRAGMGRCQGGFCSPRVLEILTKELGADPLEITKKGPGSNMLVGRIKEFLQDEGGDQNDN
ncbi:FAD dependent oxidoreductase [Tepidanaerobacter acetatoxydans Re1]|uniref:FAD dependent oxidoreductase n=1 Tax=Tepidanaerobacter acetatoxydans (strain DSM 21804 / JCM 16047 / Re1) TaxID=1209989 RepID=F4LVR3_TEPAE|nr:NAD(P)/FAD-dependent oxidoreductase [Tepidanaerobacter acetatoxydans]AEE90760.1 FAD dependent oxidoreductase [Tepidanaerobacter acetatoxydans Re1]CDI40434.1 FAD dependent oxidoreductase [Tepidanaerobacter acetatoxydans Re1]